MRKFILTLGVMAAALTVAPATAGPSEYCDLGVVPAGTTPAGIGAKIGSEPLAATVTTCNNGSAVPAPGSAKVIVNGNTKAVTLVYDGDPDSTLTPCSDGYVAAKADGSGAHLYESTSGGYSSFSRERAASEAAMDLATGCLPALPV